MIEYSLKHISGPATEPVSLAELKLQANLDPTDTSQDALLNQYISAARRDAENVLGKKIGSQVWDIVQDTWPDYCRWVIPIEPLVSVDEIEVTDEDGIVTTVSPTVYGYSAARNTLWLKQGQTWPYINLSHSGAVRVQVTVGMQPVSDESSPETIAHPATIRQAILLRAATMYRVREDVTLGTTLLAQDVKAFERLLGMERNLVP